MAPEAGYPVSTEEFELLMETVKERHKKFPDENPMVTWHFVFMNFGDQFSRVTCIEKEWSGVKKDIPLPEEGEPVRCPNGHPIERKKRMALGWVEVDVD